MDYMHIDNNYRDYGKTPILLDGPEVFKLGVNRLFGDILIGRFDTQYPELIGVKKISDIRIFLDPKILVDDDRYMEICFPFITSVDDTTYYCIVKAEMFGKQVTREQEFDLDIVITKDKPTYRHDRI